jgi:hypothetical protein
MLYFSNMKLTTFALFAASAVALPQNIERRDSVCPALLFSVPQCCDTAIGGVADLSCVTRELSLEWQSTY